VSGLDGWECDLTARERASSEGRVIANSSKGFVSAGVARSSEDRSVDRRAALVTMVSFALPANPNSTTPVFGSVFVDLLLLLILKSPFRAASRL